MSKKYFYNFKTKRCQEIKKEYRNINFRSVQKAKKMLAKYLWIDEDTIFKITKENDNYLVRATRHFYSPFADRKYFIKGLKVEFQNIETNVLNKYDNIKTITEDDYREIQNRKWTNLSEKMISKTKSIFESKVEELKKLAIGHQISKYDENLKPKFAVLRKSENVFEIFNAYTKNNLAIQLRTNEEDKFTYSELSNCTAKTDRINVDAVINRAIELIESENT